MQWSDILAGPARRIPSVDSSFEVRGHVRMLMPITLACVPRITPGQYTGHRLECTLRSDTSFGYRQQISSQVVPLL